MSANFDTLITETITKIQGEIDEWEEEHNLARREGRFMELAPIEEILHQLNRLKTKFEEAKIILVALD